MKATDRPAVAQHDHVGGSHFSLPHVVRHRSQEPAVGVEHPRGDDPLEPSHGDENRERLRREKGVGPLTGDLGAGHGLEHLAVPADDLLPQFVAELAHTPHDHQRHDHPGECNGHGRRPVTLGSPGGVFGPATLAPHEFTSFHISSSTPRPKPFAW